MMNVFINKKQFAESYKNVASSNMSDEGLIKLASFLMQHSFKSIRLAVERKNKNLNSIVGENYNPSKTYSGMANGWNKMSEKDKIEALLQQFTLNEIFEEWLTELPNLNSLIRRIKSMPSKDAEILINKLSGD